MTGLVLFVAIKNSQNTFFKFLAKVTGSAKIPCIHLENKTVHMAASLTIFLFSMWN